MHEYKFCKANGSFLAQFLYVTTILARMFLIFLLAAFTAPLVYGQYGEDLWCLILYNSMIPPISPLKWEPLSEMISCHTLYLQMMLFSMNRATCLAINME